MTQAQKNTEAYGATVMLLYGAATANPVSNMAGRAQLYHCNAAQPYLAFATASHTSLGMVLPLPGENKAPDWFPLFPDEDVFSARDKRGPFKVDGDAVLAFFADYGAALPIDLEHASHIKAPKGEAAPAYGWIKALEKRGNTVWANVDWTDDGRQLIESGAYRYISPSFLGLKLEEDDGFETVFKVVSAALTNQPALEMPVLAHHQNSPDPSIKETPMDLVKLRKMLGLADDADEAAILAAINQNKSELVTARAQAATPDLTKFVPMDTHNLVLARNKELEDGAAERVDAEIKAVIDGALEAGKITPTSVEFYTASAKSQGLDVVKTQIANLPEIGGKSQASKKAKGEDGDALSDEQIQTCRILGVSEDDYRKQLKKEEAA